MKLFLLALITMPCAFAILCYDYTDKNDDLNPMKSWGDCNDSRYCFKTYVEEPETLHFKKWIASRGCGSSSVCKTEGCTGTGDKWTCCCTGDLCNATSSPKVFLLIFFSGLYMLAL